MHDLNVESYVLCGGLAEDFSPGGGLSDSWEGLLQRGKEGARIQRRFLEKQTNQQQQQKQVVGTSNDRCVFKNIYLFIIYFGCAGS